MIHLPDYLFFNNLMLEHSNSLQLLEHSVKFFAQTKKLNKD